MVFNGFTPKLPQLVMRLVDDVSNPSFWTDVLQQPLFDICKERLLRSLRSCMFSNVSISTTSKKLSLKRTLTLL